MLLSDTVERTGVAATAVREAGFRVEEIAEPDPAPEMAAADPQAYAHLSRNAQFLFFSLARG